jgi:hypothetical protein
MYTTSRDIAGGTMMICTDCGNAISVNKICEKPIQAATDMLKHMAAHNASRASAPVIGVNIPESEALPARELASTLSASEQQWIASSLFA